MDILINIVLPLSLAVIMLSLGVGLTLADFRRVAERRWVFAVGAVCQLLLLPIVAYVIIIAFGLSGAIAAGLMLLAFCPGGVTFNVITRLANGDVALSVSLTALISLLSIFTVPLLVGWSVVHFMGKDTPEVSVVSLAIAMFVLTAAQIAHQAISKQVPGHHIQVDVKFLIFKGKRGEKVRRFQYTAIDDATRVRALKVYDKHTQANAIDFIDHIIEKFPFRISEVRTDNGHEFQTKFHWHVEDKGIRHAYIKRGTPQLNGKVERSHRSDQQEFYQLLSYKGDVDLEAKLDEWERFYNFARPHGAHNGQTPYEALRDKLQ